MGLKHIMNRVVPSSSAQRMCPRHLVYASDLGEYWHLYATIN